jgi:hypothetical protein
MSAISEKWTEEVEETNIPPPRFEKRRKGEKEKRRKGEKEKRRKGEKEKRRKGEKEKRRKSD